MPCVCSFSKDVEWVMPEEASVSEAPSEYMNRTAYLRVRSTFRLQHMFQSVHQFI